MSIVRLSLLKNRLFAPPPLGALEDVDYDPVAGVEHGFLESSTYVEGTGRSRPWLRRLAGRSSARTHSAIPSDPLDRGSLWLHALDPSPPHSWNAAFIG